MEKMNLNSKSDSKKLDESKLKAISNATSTAAVTMLLLALRERARDITNITALKAKLQHMGEQIVDEDYSRFWKELAQAGIGSVVSGRKGNPDRFKWHYSLRLVARAAIEGLGESDKVVRIQNVKPKAPKTEYKILDSTIVLVSLPNGDKMQVVMPKTASQDDVKRLGEYLLQF